MDILEETFGLRVRVKILKILFNKGNKMYESKIALEAGLPRTSVQNDLKKLLKIGLLRRELTKTRTFYSVNKDFKYYGPLKTMFENN